MSRSLFTQPDTPHQQQALTHRSFGAHNNERLEFLGDAVLSLCISDWLYAKYPALSEGELSRMRALLVREETLHQLALSLNLGAHLRLGAGEQRSGGQARASILADALEALFGAIYLDAGFTAAQGVIDKLYAPLIDELRPGHFQKDAKTRLQEWLQGRKKPLPRYQVIEASGAAHEQRFEVACEIENPALRTTGQGSSRRLAEQAAADRALKALKA